MHFRSLAAAFAASVALPICAAHATDLEVTHWWTSGGEAAAVAEFAKAFDATGNKWVDAAIAGSGSTARPIMISRITGGDPMGATQFNHGRQAEELVEAGLMRDLSDVAAEEKWTEVINPPSLLELLHSRRQDLLRAGQHPFVAVAVAVEQGLRRRGRRRFRRTGPSSSPPHLRSRAAGKIPLAMGKQPWQASGAFNVMVLALGGTDLYNKIFVDKDAEAAAGPEMAAIWKAADDARKMAAKSNVQDWNQATNMVITDQAGGQIMGDWAQGEFQVAGEVAGTDYSCLPGLGDNAVLGTAGDAFYFPLIEDEEVSAAQAELARVMLSPETQVAFNLKKGSLPVRGDVDIAAANDCMKKGLEIVAAGNTVTSTDQLISPDTNTQLEDLLSEFFSDMSLTPADAQARWAAIIADAD